MSDAGQNIHNKKIKQNMFSLQGEQTVPNPETSLSAMRRRRVQRLCSTGDLGGGGGGPGLSPIGGGGGAAGGPNPAMGGAGGGRGGGGGGGGGGGAPRGEYIDGTERSIYISTHSTSETLRPGRSF